MTQHKALFVQSERGAFSVGTTETLQPAPGDVLVRIEATALNPADWKIQKHAIVSLKYPAILGLDSAGVVEKVGNGVTEFKEGDRVVHQGFYTNDAATFQQYTTVPAEILAKLPANISFEEAASIPVGLATAAIAYYNAPEGGVGLTPPWEPTGEGKYKGQGILVLGGASSVGQFAIQFARLSGFSPIVTTASLHNTDLLKSFGATHVIDRRGDVVAEALKILKDAPSIVYDAISLDDTQEQGWKILAPNGQLVLVLPPKSHIKNGEDDKRTSYGEDDKRTFYGEDGKRAFWVYGTVHVQRDLGRSLYANLTELLESGKIKPSPVEVLPGGLAGIEEGLKRLEENRVSGQKLIAKPQETP